VGGLDRSGGSEALHERAAAYNGFGMRRRWPMAARGAVSTGEVVSYKAIDEFGFAASSLQLPFTAFCFEISDGAGKIMGI